MTANWKKFIQVNIYGRTLEDLQRDGIILETVLNELGCSNVWIMEGMYAEKKNETIIDQDLTKLLNVTEPLMNTTVETVKCPRFSTPAHSQISNCVSMNFTSDLSCIHSHDRDNFVSESLNNTSNTTLMNFPTSNQDVIKDVLNEIVEHVDEMSKLYKSFPVKMLQSTTMLDGRQIEDESRPHNDTIFHSYAQSNIEVFVTPPVMQLRKSSERVYAKLETVRYEDEAHWEDPPACEPYGDYSFDGWNDVDGDFFSVNNETNQLHVNETLEIHTPPPPNLMQAKSILRKSGVSGHSRKMVSFKVHDQQKDHQEKLNKLHNIKCCFPGCGREISWKLRYGKLRLIDHALIHADQKLLKCRVDNCDFMAMTIRQMRYHYGKQHKNTKMEGFGILEIQSEAINLSAIWKLCFQGQFGIVGNVSAVRNQRRRERTKVSAQNVLTGDVVQ